MVINDILPFDNNIITLNEILAFIPWFIQQEVFLKLLPTKPAEQILCVVNATVTPLASLLATVTVKNNPETPVVLHSRFFLKEESAEARSSVV